MKKWKKLTWLGTILAASLALAAAYGSGQSQSTKTGHNATIKGYVIDSSCTFKNHLKKPVSSGCAEKCAREGSPLVILTSDGTIYLPISGDMPAKGQNEKLMKYAGQLVTVTGTTYTYGGSRAIVIEKIEAAQSS